MYHGERLITGEDFKAHVLIHVLIHGKKKCRVLCEYGSKLPMLFACLSVVAKVLPEIQVVNVSISKQQDNSFWYSQTIMQAQEKNLHLGVDCSYFVIEL